MPYGVDGFVTSIVLDLEANDFLPIVDKIWVVCAKVVGADDVFDFYDALGFVRWLDEVKPTRVIWHNGLCYDADVLRKVWKIPYSVGRMSSFGSHKVQFIDTMLLSQRLNPDREGGHSLDNLAKLAGSHKTDYRKRLIELGVLKGNEPAGYEFKFFHEEMPPYCGQDVRADEDVYKMLLKEIEKL